MRVRCGQRLWNTQGDGGAPHGGPKTATQRREREESQQTRSTRGSTRARHPVNPRRCLPRHDRHLALEREPLHRRRHPGNDAPVKWHRLAADIAPRDRRRWMLWVSGPVDGEGRPRCGVGAGFLGTGVAG